MITEKASVYFQETTITIAIRQPCQLFEIFSSGYNVFYGITRRIAQFFEW